MTPKPNNYIKCVFTEGGVKCGERALPVTRHCRKHILEVPFATCVDKIIICALQDPNQILFRACSKVYGDMECATPVEAVFDNATCRLHMDIPSVRSYTHVRVRFVCPYFILPKTMF